MKQHTGTRVIILGLLALAILAIVLAVLMNSLESRGLLDPAELTPAQDLFGLRTPRDGVDIDQIFSSIANTDRSISGVVVISGTEGTRVTEIQEIITNNSRYLRLHQYATAEPDKFTEAIERDGTIYMRYAPKEDWVTVPTLPKAWPGACKETEPPGALGSIARDWFALWPCVSGQATPVGDQILGETVLRRYSLTTEHLDDSNTALGQTIELNFWFVPDADLPSVLTWKTSSSDEMSFSYGWLELDYGVNKAIIPTNMEQ